MNGVNVQLLIGNIGRNAEIRTIDGSRSKATFSVATNKSYKNREGQSVTNTYWHNIVVWDPKLVDIVQRHCTTGRQVFVEGESTIRSYQDRNGNTQDIREIKATKVMPIEQMDEAADTSGSMNRAFIVGRLAEKPVSTTNEMGEASCTLVFKSKESTFPVELTGAKAEVAARYLDVDRIAYVRYEIVSVHPFKAVGLDLTLLGRRPESQQGTSHSEGTEQKPQFGNAVNASDDSNDSDELPF